VAGALIVAARRQHASSALPDVRVLAIAALVAFGAGALATVAIKQVVAYTLVDPNAGHAFFSHLTLYASVPEATGWRPGILRPFIRLLQTSYVLTYGSRGGGLCACRPHRARLRDCRRELALAPLAACWPAPPRLPDGLVSPVVRG
jgi:hypothetical protein